MADGNRADVLDELERLRQCFDHLIQHSLRTDDRERVVVEGLKRLESIRGHLSLGDDWFSQIAENIREVLWITSPDYGVMHFVSPAYADIWGRSCEELLREPQTWAAAIHEADRDRVHTALLRDSHLGRFDEEYRIVRPDGTVRWIHDRAFPVRDPTGEVYRIVGIAEDVTARKEREQAFQDAHHESDRRMVEDAVRKERQFSDQIIRSVSEGIVAFNRDLCYTIWNPGMEQITGMSAEDVLGKHAFKAFPFLTATGADKPHTDTLAGKSFVVTDQPFDIPERGKAGYYEAHYSPLRDESGEVIGGLAVVRDVTERRRAAEETRQQREDLAHIARVSTLGEMATGIAHELNQPLSAIATYGFTARTLFDASRIQSPKLDQVLDKIENQAIRAGEIVDRLRRFVRKTPPDHVPVRVDRLVEDVVTFLSSDSRLTEIVPELVVEADGPLVIADPIQIQQVLINLIRNSLDAMNAQELASQCLTIAARDTGDGFAEVVVSDTGVGVEAEHQDQVFDTFFSTKDDGLGMGLAISRSIVEEHGGRLWFESSAGAGTTFRFTLPVVEAGTDEDARIIS